MENDLKLTKNLQTFYLNKRNTIKLLKIKIEGILNKHFFLTIKTCLLKFLLKSIINKSLKKVCQCYFKVVFQKYQSDMI